MRFVTLVAGIWFAVGCIAGCAHQPTSTALTIHDYDYVVNETARHLRASEFLAGRTPTSEPITITLEKVENLTSDIIPESEQWKFLMDVQESVPLQLLANQMNIHFQVRPERLEKERSAGWKGAAASYLPPTHVMSAVFRSATRVTNDQEGYVSGRVDQYQLEYSIIELKTGSIAWDSIVELKREALDSAND